jgi:hypothetical protein
VDANMLSSMTFPRKRMIALASLVAVVALTLIPGVTAAQASNSSNAAAVFAAVNNFRASNGALPALKHNGYLSVYAQDLAKVYATCGVGCIPGAKTSENPPENSTTLFTFAEKATGSGRSGKIDTKFFTDWGPQLTESLNYGAVGYVTKGSTDYAILVIALYSLPPLDLMTAGSVTVSGTAQVGKTLTAHPGTFSPTPDSYTYNWVSGTGAGAVPVGSNLPTYVPRAADLGKIIRVVIGGAKTGYQGASDSSPNTAKVKIGTLVHPSSQVVLGSHNVGSTLTAGISGWQSGTSLTAQWLRNGKKISLATGGTYELQPADKGKKVDVSITGALSGYTTKTLTSHTTHTTGNELLTTTPVPTLSGAHVYLSTLTAVPGVWGPGAVHLSYQWYIGSKKVSGATKISYKLGTSAVGKNVSVKVTGSESGWASVSEQSVGPLISPLDFGGSGGPSITGPTTLKTGATLTAHAGSWIPTPTSYLYTWYRDGTAITHATSHTYTLKSSDNGHNFTVFVEVLRAGYDSTGGTSGTFHAAW